MKFLSIIYCIFLIFPYVQIISLSSYTQPNALLVGLLIFFISIRFVSYIPLKDRIVLIGLALLGSVLFLLTCVPYNNPQEYKYLLNYVAPLVLTAAAFQVLRWYKNIVVFFLHISICIWFLVAAVQSLFDPGFMTGLIGSWGEHVADIVDSGRGVLGLAPEPTHHGFHIVILAACLALLDSSRRGTWLVLLCLFEAVVWAQSSSAVMALGLACLVYFVFSKPHIGIPLFGCIFLILFFSLSLLPLTLPEDSRMLSLLSEVIQEPTNVLSIDYSVNMRLGGMLSVAIDVFDHFFMPRGLSHETWLDARVDILAKHDWLMDLSEVGPPSGVGVLAFQGGALVLPFIFLMFYRILGMHGMDSIRKIVVISTLFIFLGQYYLSASGFSLLYACAIYRAQYGINRKPPKRSKALVTDGVGITNIQVDSINERSKT